MVNQMPTLELLVPTYNREKMLNKFLSHHLPICKELNVSITIFDNCSPDETKNVVSKYMPKYKSVLRYIFCQKHITSYEINLLALNNHKADYAWIVGDSYKISDALMQKVIDLLNKQPDQIVCNLNDIIPTSCSAININYIGITSCLGVTVFSSETVCKYLDCIFSKSFPQTNLMLSSSASSPRNTFFISNPSLEMLDFQHRSVAKNKHWTETDRVYDILSDWVELVDCFSDHLGKKNIPSAYRSFGNVSGLTKIRGIMKMRAFGVISIYKVLNNKQLFSKVSVVPLCLMMGICLIPEKIANHMYHISLKLRKII
ncbi:MAG: glycosyltransferase [Pseudomonadota bacterium]|nr:glycosyltransferase [Pseudomonadota bacterium]